jgi:hypothetical protein
MFLGDAYNDSLIRGGTNAPFFSQERKPSEQICEACDRANRAVARYCIKCGKPLTKPLGTGTPAYQIGLTLRTHPFHWLLMGLCIFMLIYLYLTFR